MSRGFDLHFQFDIGDVVRVKKAFRSRLPHKVTSALVEVGTVKYGLDGNTPMYLCGELEPFAPPPPPLGIMPRAIWIEARILEIERAAGRYAAAGKPIPQEWHVEWLALNREVSRNGNQ